MTARAEKAPQTQLSANAPVQIRGKQSGTDEPAHPCAAVAMPETRRKSTLARNLCWFVSCLLALALAFSLYFPLASSLSGSSYPSLLGLRQAVVLSNSMAPTLKAGDVIMIHEEMTYQIGDILTYRDRQGLVTHRLIAANDEGMLLQGDANRSPDSAIQADQVLGKMVLRLPAVGRLALWLHAMS